MDGPSWHDLSTEQRLAAARSALPPGFTIVPDEIEQARVRESEEVFYKRILRSVEDNEIPGMEAWNVRNAADLMRRMWAAYSATAADKA